MNIQKQLEKYYYFMFECKEGARLSRVRSDLFQHIFQLNFASLDIRNLDFSYVCIWKNIFKSYVFHFCYGLGRLGHTGVPDLELALGFGCMLQNIADNLLAYTDCQNILTVVII